MMFRRGLLYPFNYGDTTAHSIIISPLSLNRGILHWTPGRKIKGIFTPLIVVNIQQSPPLKSTDRHMWLASQVESLYTVTEFGAV